MKRFTDYIKECLDVDNFEYKFDVWFKSDKEHKKPMLDMLTILTGRRMVQKEDIDAFIEKYPKFKIKKFVDFFDEDVTRDDAVTVDYVYLFMSIIKTFISNITLQNKISYEYQALSNGQPNVEVGDIPLPPEKEEDKKEEN